MPDEREDGRSRATILQFPGLRLRMDEYRLNDGASHEQVNCVSRNNGTLQDRGGMLPVVFEGE